MGMERRASLRGLVGRVAASDYTLPLDASGLRLSVNWRAESARRASRRGSASRPRCLRTIASTPTRFFP